MSQTAEYIKRLSSLQEGDLSRLRSLSGRGLDATLQGFDLFTGLWWPLRAKSPATPRREPSWLVAKFYGAYNVPHVGPETGPGHTLPEVLARCEPEEDNVSARFRTRFDNLLCSPLSSLEPPLRWALGEVAGAVAGRVPHAQDIKGLDWVQLLDDLSIWDRGVEHRRGRDVRDLWAEMYLRVIEKKRRRT